MGRGRNPTAGELSLWLHQYQQLNDDLAKPVSKQLFLFAAASYCHPDQLEELFDRPLGQTPRRHRSFFWYNIMLTSGVGWAWDEFASLKNSGVSMRDCLVRIRRLSSPEEWLTLSRRIGCGIFRDASLLNPHDYSKLQTKTTYWSRGGVWDKRNGLTKVIVLDESLEREPYNLITTKLLPHCDKLAKEVHNLVDEEAMLVPDAIDRAVDYVRHRVRDLVGWKAGPTHYRNVSWFFQADVPVGAVWHNWKKTIPTRLVDKGKVIHHHWFPPKTEKT
jgi:hypothetical protein